MTTHTDTDVVGDLKDLEHAFRKATDPDEKLSILYDIGVVIGGFPNARRAQLTIDRWHNRAVDIYDLDPNDVTRELGDGIAKGRKQAEEKDKENRELDAKVIGPDGKPLSSTKQKFSWRNEGITAQDLRLKTFPPIKFVLPGFIAEGLSLLVGKPKQGKSWMALDICLAATTDRFTLGSLKPLQGDVLYLALEDSRRRLQRRIGKLLPTFDGNWPARLTLATEWPRFDEGGLPEIEDWCNSVTNPVLIVVDTLAKVRPAAKANHTLYDADYDALTGLQVLAGRRGVAIVVIHHVRKMEAEDPFDTVSGTNGLTGCVDAILVIKRSAAGTILHVRGRDLEDSETAAQFDKATCRWTLLGAAAEVHRSAERDRVLAALKGAPEEGFGVQEIMVAADMKRGAADKILQRMAAAGDIERRKRGRYSIASRSADPSDIAY